MKEKVTIRHAVSSHLRGIKELHKVSPKFFPLLTLHCFFSAIFPYISVFFSAQILTELATLRRADTNNFYIHQVYFRYARYNKKERKGERI